MAGVQPVRQAAAGASQARYAFQGHGLEDAENRAHDIVKRGVHHLAVSMLSAESSPSPRPSPPRRGRSIWACLGRSLTGGCSQPMVLVLPLLGERAGVRANIMFESIVRA